MKILNLHYDHDLENLCDWDGQWKLYSFSNRHKSFAHPDRFFPEGKPSIGLQRKLAVGTAFVLSYFEHSGCVWSLRGTGPQCQWDSVDVAGLLVWEHPVKDLGSKTYEERSKDAKSFLETYTAWCNGEGYGYSVKEVVTLECGHTEMKDLDSCFGFYGNDLSYMFEQIREAIGDDQEVEVKGEARDLAQYHEYKKPTKKSA